MYPSDVDLANITAADINNEKEIDLTEIHNSLAFDYETNTFQIIDGANKIPGKVDAIKQWIELFIRTEKSKYLIYTDEFGLDLSDLVGYRLPRSYQVAEIIRRVTEGILTKCPCVESVHDWDFDKGHFSFTVKTTTGEEVRISE